MIWDRLGLDGVWAHSIHDPCLLSFVTVGDGVCAGDKVELPAPGTWVGAAGAVLRNASLFKFNVGSG